MKDGKGHFIIEFKLNTLPAPNEMIINLEFKPKCLESNQLGSLQKVVINNLVIKEINWGGEATLTRRSLSDQIRNNNDLIVPSTPTRKLDLPIENLKPGVTKAPPSQLDKFYESLLREKSEKKKPPINQLNEAPKIEAVDINELKKVAAQKEEARAAQQNQDQPKEKDIKHIDTIEENLAEPVARTKSEQLRDSINWENAKRENTFLDYYRFLDNDVYKEKAMKNLMEVFEQEQVEWAEASSGNNSESYKTYIENYPNGYYTLEAIDSIKILNPSTDITRLAERSITNYIGKLVSVKTVVRNDKTPDWTLGEDTMFVNDWYLLSIELQSDTSGYFLKRPFNKESQAYSLTFDLLRKISDNICIQLSDPNQSSFTIDPANCTSKNIDLANVSESNGEQPPLWEWKVKPLVTGHNSLVVAIGRMEGQDFHPSERSRIISYFVIDNEGSKLFYAYLALALLVILGIFYFVRDKIDAGKPEKYFTLDSDEVAQIKEYISNNEILVALKILKEQTTNQKPLSDIALFISRLNDLNENEYKGLITKEDSEAKFNTFKNNLLSYLDDRTNII
ncbi:MAG: hypothetical protein AAFZ15_31140 [Bacteroidota bacterium]